MKIQTSIITWTEEIPAGTSLSVEVNVHDGTSWFGWNQIENGKPIPDALGVDIDQIQIQIRPIFSSTEDLDQTPTITDIAVTVHAFTTLVVKNLTTKRSKGSGLAIKQSKGAGLEVTT